MFCTILLIFILLRRAIIEEKKIHLTNLHLRTNRKKIIFFGGTGTQFAESLGYFTYIRDNYDLRNVFFIGASGGALCAAIGALEIPTEYALSSPWHPYVDPPCAMDPMLDSAAIPHQSLPLFLNQKIHPP